MKRPAAWSSLALTWIAGCSQSVVILERIDGGSDAMAEDAALPDAEPMPGSGSASALGWLPQCIRMIAPRSLSGASLAVTRSNRKSGVFGSPTESRLSSVQ